MQVSEQKDHITHAVIGGGKTIDFGISNSAEFFNILSSTLYKDQRLAVAREVLCNANDAHIEAGCTDIPIKITLTREKFIIRDQGKGIHRDDMGLIYGTYGNSTKKNDGTQTGGFGLGCKAPFAYTDHFEVTSNHDGVRTIYNLSKSSAQAQGKPGIVPIASFPTDQTGLTVSIPIKDHDYHKFYSLIERIVRNGDMNMTLNGVKIETLGFDNSVASVFITSRNDIVDGQERIMIRYGNVIYPVGHSEEFALNYGAIQSHLEKLGRGMFYNYSIIFQAPPHSIAVTPSRESLSMQGHTIKTLQTLFGDFVTMLNTDFPLACTEVANDIVLEAVKNKRIAQLLSTEDVLPIDRSVSTDDVKNIYDLPTMASRFIQSNYPQDLGFRKRDIKLRLIEMSKAGQLDQGLVQTYLRAMEEVQSPYQRYYRENTSWLQKHVIARIAGKLTKANLPIEDHLYVYDPEDSNAVRSGYDRRENSLIPADKVCPKHLFNALPYLRNIVVLVTSTRNLQERIKKHDVFKEMGDAYGFVVYRTGLKKSTKEGAIAFFNASNMRVVDLTFKQSWELDPVNKVPVVPRKKPKVGIACLSSVYTDKGRYIDLMRFTDEDAARIIEPEFIAEVSLRAENSKSNFGYDWCDQSSRYIVELFGDKGGITNKSDVAVKYKAAGAKDFKEYVQEKVSAYMITSPTIQEYWAFNINRVRNVHSVDHTSLLETIYANPALRAEYGLVNNLTDEDKKYIYIWNQMMHRWHRNEAKCVLATKDHLDAIPLHQANKDLVAKFKGNRLLRVINDSGLASLINRSSSDPVEAKEALDLLNSILNK